MRKKIPSFSIGSLFESRDSYVIPIYHRNYTWGLGEITQLIQDVYDFAFDTTKSQANYYIGTLVVYERHVNGEISYEIIDGQQRLTTLKLILNALHRKFKDKIIDKIDDQLTLSFDSRKKSTETLEVITNHNQEEVTFISSKSYNPQIKQRYFDAEKVLDRFLHTEEEVNTFYNYLVNKVKVVRVSVPEETDLNHYFEIMNNRGEQLEKHEILKANMLEVVKHDAALSYTFNTIWEACSDMERYVQYGFSPKQRDSVFSYSNWNNLKLNSLEEIAAEIYEVSEEEKDSQELSLDKIVSYKGSFKNNIGEKEDSPERFTSVVNFSNFLLHVLRIHTNRDVALDDKRLIDSFNVFLDNKNEEEQYKFVKEFGFSLLKIKHLFDQFIIKREFIREKDQWSLKTLRRYTGNKVKYINRIELDGEFNTELIMLLSMFHVSTPTLVYKHWLNGALHYLFNQDDPDPIKYKDYLLHLAKSYFFDRYIAQDPIDYYAIIYKNKSISMNEQSGLYDVDLLDQGTSVENFVFNYLDYILWQEDVENSSSFEFTFRSSVEHYYPQNPISKDHKIKASIYDKFGNLCLISSSKNSRLSNHMPTAKKGYYYKVGADSLKQQLMMEEDTWGENEIIRHSLLMKDKLTSFNQGG